MTARNIVMVTYDSLRADHCGYMGYGRDTTPTLDAMAKSGTGFTNAIAPASRTNPSMAGILTGEHMVVRGQVADSTHSRRHLARHGTIAESLSEQGYATGAFNPNAYASRHYGFDRGFDQFEDFLFSNDRYEEVFKKHLSDSSLYTVIRNFRNYLRREEAFKTWDRYIDDVEAWVHEQSEPFFLWMFSLDTHFPHLTPRRHREWSTLFQQYYYNWRCNQLIDDLDPDLSDREIQKIIDIYDDSICFGDVLLAELQDRLSEYDPVYVVFGDHGEAFGERGVYGHFYPSLHKESIHVPLVVSECLGEEIDPDAPISLCSVPNLIDIFTDSNSSLDTAPWVVATDYDGRYNRNLITIRTRHEKIISSKSEGSDSTNCQYQIIGTEKPKSRLEKHLTELTERRKLHERETLVIERRCRELGKF